MIQGQWSGDFIGSGNGRCTVNIEKKANELSFFCYLLTYDRRFPSTFAYFKVEDGKSEYNITISEGLSLIGLDCTIVPNHRKDEALKIAYPDMAFPTKADLHIKVVGNELKINVLTDIKSEVNITLVKEISESSNLLSESVSWDDFKEIIKSVEYRKVAFRGQKDIWPLRTSFHRTNRCDVIEYSFTDIPMLHRHLSSLTNHYFDLKDSQHYGAFFNLLQHHGYPTPLLDWTYSPFVSAFFAFHQISKSEVDSGEIGRKARIFALDIDNWKKDYAQYSSILDCRPHLSVGEYLAIDNTRSLPQQAITTLTNIFDIEGYLKSRGESTQKCYLRAYDISIKETPAIMRELSMMGITYGSLFPGLDGACNDLRRINFSDYY